MRRPVANECGLCGRRSRLTSEGPGVCATCLREQPEDALPIAASRHALSRKPFDLPERPPETAGGVPCPLCARGCVLGAGERGFCGLREGDGRRLHQLAGTPAGGLLDWYRDPLPTNCVVGAFGLTACRTASMRSIRLRLAS